ncbi:MAG: glycosyltransferase family 4 protein [Chloroflexota bacterium]
MRPSLTILSPLALHPALSGGAAHIQRTALQLARYYEVSIYTITPEPAGAAWGPLSERCRELRAFRRGPVAGSWLDPPAARMERSAELERHLRSAWRRDPPDIVQIEFTTLAHYAPLARAAGALAVCTAHNLAFLAQLRRARRERSPLLRARRMLGALSMWRYELRTLRACDLVITLSEGDASALRRWAPGLPVACVPPGIELDPVARNPVDGLVLFVGGYLHPPNVEGAIWLAREVWPLVRAARPGALLVLAGRDPPPQVRALAGHDIEVPGTLPDLAPLYERASVAAAAVFWGGGVRIKILDALAAGIPVVSTAAAADGLPLVHGESALLAETPEEFARALVLLLNDGRLRARIGAAGRAIVARSHAAERSGRLLAGLYEGARAGLTRR